MAKPSSSRWLRIMSGFSSPSGDALLFFLAIFFFVSLLTHGISRISVLAAEFEGFDADDVEHEEEANEAFDPKFLKSSPLTPTSLTQTSFPESHHGPPPSSAAELPTDDASVSAEKPLASSAFELWDDEEFEGIPVHIADPTSESPSLASENPVGDGVGDGSAVNASNRQWRLSSYFIEILCISFLIIFIINYFIGKRQNELIALCWASQFATKDSIFDKNFSLLGTGDGKEDSPLLLKEGQDVFKFYASGRRYCQGLIATMELRSRHDLIARVMDLLLNKKDSITFGIVMNEDAMDHVVLAIARKKMARSMHKDAKDLHRFATVMATQSSGRRWVAEELMVVTESKEVAGDLMTDVVIDQVFGEKAFDKFGKGFISLHFTDQHPGSCKKLLLFKFALPHANNMVDLTRLITLVPYYIDLIGRYKLSIQARSKTEAPRAKAAQESLKEMQSARQEALQKRRAEKKRLIEEAEAKLSAEAVRRKEEKERARQMKKLGPKVRMLRSH
ncbi:Uncharacterized protein AXF42_Ash016803 [Apostasia shenzhenica]|uniref:Coiled-coil domain-containing protein 47 n=1 Tax=Apostasia shenzhenica TaxID=1088818 RepID=A0A2I0BAD7_9ASPA|nr:Uncharacterized protein AXF42_Ash016803 [Apostasia shenzhenica]